MSQLAFHVATKIVIAIVSGSFFSFFTQVAVFKYTRSVDAPIPAQDIFGLPFEGFSLLVAVVWFFVFFTISLVWLPLRVVLRKARGGDNGTSEQDYEIVRSLSNIRQRIFWSSLGSFLVALVFIFSPSLTGEVLKYLGHGGGVSVCYPPSEKLQDFNRDIEQAQKNPERSTFLSNNIRGKMIFLTGHHAYIQILPRNDDVATSSSIVGGKTVPGNYVVLRSDFLSAGYHLIERSTLSGNC